MQCRAAPEKGGVAGTELWGDGGEAGPAASSCRTGARNCRGTSLLRVARRLPKYPADYRLQVARIFLVNTRTFLPYSANIARKNNSMMKVETSPT